MTDDRLCQLAKEYTEVQELLEDNHRLSVAYLALRLERTNKDHIEIQKGLEKRLSAVERHGEVLEKALATARQEYKKLRMQVERKNGTE